jgi:hypothetical protein
VEDAVIVTAPGVLSAAAGVVASGWRAVYVAACWHHVAFLADGHQSGLMVLAALTLTGALAALLAQGAWTAAAATAVPLGCRAAALRAKSWRAAFLPQRDPDARGRTRPRAPAAGPAVA